MTGKNILLIITLSTQIGSCNIFSDFADKGSKEARIEDAILLIDQGKYTDALEILDNLAIEFPTDTQVATLRSSAYAGAAGIGLMDIGFNMASMATSVDPTQKPFEAYLGLVASPTATEYAYAIAARESLIMFNSDPSKRTNEMNMYLTILSYGIVATILSVTGDTDNDKRADTGFDCASISDDDAKEAIYTYAIAKQSTEYASGSSLWDSIESQVLGFTSALEALGMDLSITSKSEIDSLQCTAMKSLMVGGLLGEVKACPCS